MKIIFGIVLSLVASSAFSVTFVVSPDGKAVAAGSKEYPLNSINAAVNKAGAGDTILVRKGTYNEAVAMWKSGTATAPIKLQAYPGEEPVIDGQGKLPVDDNYALIFIGGSYWDVAGFEVRNSRQYGIDMPGHHNALHKMNVHHTQLHGVIARGDYSLVEDSRVWQASLENYKGAGGAMWGCGLAAIRDLVNGITDGAILRRNVAYNNWGEGIATFESNDILIEDNVSYDNYAVNLYVADARNITVRRNLVYTTQESVSLFGRAARGIGMSNEVNFNPLSNITIANNLVYGTSAPFIYFANTGPNTLRNALIAHNTFVNGVAGHAGDGTTVVIGAGTFTNVRFVNNLVIQDDASPVVSVPANQRGLRLASNFWSKAPQADAAASGDLVADPRLLRTGLTMPAINETTGDARAGNISAEAFRPSSDSPVLDQAKALPDVQADYFGTVRNAKTAFGAIATPPKN